MLGKCWAGFFATYHSNESYRKRQDLGFLENGFNFKVRQIMKLAKIFRQPLELGFRISNKCKCRFEIVYL
jgi:hypothetical protein